MQSSSLIRSALAAGALATALFAAPLAAQSTFQGALSGAVVDAAGRAINAADVRITERASLATRSVVTGRDGLFRFTLLGPGTYDIAVEALGYRPVRYLGVSVASGGSPSVRITLRGEAPPVVRIDTVQASGVRAAPLTWINARGYSELVGGRRLATDAALLSPVADDQTVEGLPWRFADAMVDGARLGVLGTPGDAGSLTTALALPMRGMGDVQVGGMGYDVEAGGSGVGLTGLSLRGGGNAALRAAAFGGTSDVGGAVIVGGAMQRDTAHAVVGVDYQRSEIARPEWFTPTDAAGLALVGIARDSFSTDLAPYANATARVEERASGFGRLDWQLGERSAISLRAAGSRLVVGYPPLLGQLEGGLASSYEANGAQVAVDVLTRIRPRLSAEVRLSGDVTEVSSNRANIPATAFAGRGVTVGAAGTEPFRDQLAVPRVTAMLHWDLGAHRLKIGTTFATSRTESQGTAGTLGEFAFGDATDFAAGAGSWRGVVGNANSGNFGLSETSVFAQDAWTVTDGLQVSMGLRIDRQKFGVGSLERNTDWTDRTGLDNTDVRDSRVRVAPRLGFVWQLGDQREWVLDGGVGVFNALPDRRDLGDALALDRGLEVRSALGSLDRWPSAPTNAASRGRTIALLGPALEGPRTRRLTFGLLRHFGEWSAYVRGVYRQTDFLSRRRDLNLPVAPSGEDQYGRPLYGALQQVGSLVAAVPGSNRRFADFDAATAIEVTGYSEYGAAITGIERVVDQGLSFGLHYTFSRTSDNLAGGSRLLAPLPLSVDGAEWADGRSDFDAPHRLLAAAEYSPSASGALRLGAILRLQSGAPFTAGFRDGVDANGDGVAGNDPAFVDPALPGMDALLDANSCLELSSGTFAERNACRGDMTTRLDLRAAIRLASMGGSPVELVIDAMDVLGTERGPVDRALYLVDRTGTLSLNGTTGVTTVPLVVNPNFGALLADRAPGILLRVGLRIGR